MVREAAIVAQKCSEARETGIIDLRDCGLMEIPQALFFFVKNVEVGTVDVSKNQLKKLPIKLVKSFPKIMALDCSDNLLENVPSLEDCQVDNMKVVKLSGNKLSKIPLGLPSSLELLDLSHNSISSLSEEDIDFLKSTTGTINLSGNSLDTTSSLLLEKSSLQNLIL